MFNHAKIVGLKCLIDRLLIISRSLDTDLVLVVSSTFPTHKICFGL